MTISYDLITTMIYNFNSLLWSKYDTVVAITYIDTLDSCNDSINSIS